MPTDTDEKPEVDEKPPSSPPRRSERPPGPSEEDVRSWVREEIVAALGGLGKQPEAPDLSTDRKLEAYVQKITRDAVAELAAAEAAAGKPPVDDKPDATHEPESQPEASKPWQERLRSWLWGPG